MQMRPDIQITAMLKAMTDVVIPALGTSNKLATEQAQLVVGMLSLMKAQLPMQFRFDRDELMRLVSTATRIEALTGMSVVAHQVAALIEQRDAAASLLEACRVDPAELQGTVRNLRQTLCELIDALGQTEAVEAQEVIEKLVMSMTKAQLQRDRALMKPQGWEADPDALPDIATLI